MVSFLWHEESPVFLTSLLALTVSCFKDYLNEFPNRAVSQVIYCHFIVKETEHKEVNSVPKVPLLTVSRRKVLMHGLRTPKLDHVYTLSTSFPEASCLFLSKIGSQGLCPTHLEFLQRPSMSEAKVDIGAPFSNCLGCGKLSLARIFWLAMEPLL